jgi:hypothetical protein
MRTQPQKTHPRKRVARRAALAFTAAALFASVVGSTPGAAQSAGSSTTGSASSSTTLTVPRPADAAPGSVLVAVVDATLSSSDSMSPPAGWTLIRRDNGPSTSPAIAQAMYYKAVGSSEPSSYAWSFSTATNAVGGVVAFTGVDPTNPVEEHHAMYSGRTKSISAPSVTTLQAGDLLVAFFGNTSAKSTNTPSGMTESFDVQGSGIATAGASSVQSTPGQTGTRTASYSGSPVSGALGQMVALRASGAAPPPPTSVPPPVNTALPAVSGSAQTGSTLTGSSGTWTSTETPSLAYQWKRCDSAGASCASVSGATGSSYTLASGDAGSTFRVVVTASNSGGSSSATSAQTAVVTAPAPSSQPPITIYTSPTGSSTATGDAPTNPTTLSAAYQRSLPGDIIGLTGTYTLTSPFYIGRSGSASGGYIVYRSYNGAATIKENLTAGSPLFRVNEGVHHIEFNGLTFDGQGHYNAYEAIFVARGAHHVNMLNNTVLRMSAAGLSCVGADYLVAVGNKVWRFGDGHGWSSGISFNWGSGNFWADTAPGFHNVIANNYVAGGVDGSTYLTDGNGIILDLGGNISPTLIANNVVYMNGGRGIETLQTTGKVYIVNNTMYKNALDPRMAGIGELVTNQGSGVVNANNVVSAWTGRYTYQQFSATSLLYSKNSQWGGKGTQNVSSSDPSQIVAVDPLLVSPPAVDPSASGQWANAPRPENLGSALMLQSGSTVDDNGVDPRTLPGLDSAMLAGINAYAMDDVNGVSRPQGTGFSYGAYER